MQKIWLFIKSAPLTSLTAVVAGLFKLLGKYLPFCNLSPDDINTIVMLLLVLAALFAGDAVWPKLPKEGEVKK